MRAGRRIAPRNKSGRRVSGRGPSAYTALCTFSPRCSNTRNRAYATMSVTGMAKIISIRPGSFGGFFVEQLAQAGGQLLIAHLVGGSSPLLFCGSARTRLRRRQADAAQRQIPRPAVGARGGPRRGVGPPPPPPRGGAPPGRPRARRPPPPPPIPTPGRAPSRAPAP